MGKTKCYGIRIKFQERDSPHVHSFIWIFNAPNIEYEVAYIEFIEKTNEQLPDHFNDSELFELVQTYQVYTHSRTWLEIQQEWILHLLWSYFTEKTIIAKLLGSKFSNEEKQEILTWRNTLLSQVKSYIDNNLYPAKLNAINPTKGNFTQPLSVKEILDELEIPKDDYDTALSISKDEDL